jgi:hypothetical protein
MVLSYHWPWLKYSFRSNLEVPQLFNSSPPASARWVCSVGAGKRKRQQSLLDPDSKQDLGETVREAQARYRAHRALKSAIACSRLLLARTATLVNVGFWCEPRGDMAG